jgi:predicted nucleic acid-binding protein
MLLIDTSVWISVFRDRTGQIRPKLEVLINDRDVFLTRFTQLELLQGSLNEKEWTLLSTYLETQDYIELTNDSWQAAARIFYDLRRQGLTVRSPIDCCIAQAALGVVWFNIVESARLLERLASRNRALRGFLGRF